MYEKELREILATYGYGLELLEFSKHDRVNVYPTKRHGIHKLSLELRRHLSDITAQEILKHLLTTNEFNDWQYHLEKPKAKPESAPSPCSHGYMNHQNCTDQPDPDCRQALLEAAETTQQIADETFKENTQP